MHKQSAGLLVLSVFIIAHDMLIEALIHSRRGFCCPQIMLAYCATLAVQLLLLTTTVTALLQVCGNHTK